MSRDIYSSLSGAKAAWLQMESLANNLSNTNTASFKEQRMTFKAAAVNAGPLGDSFVVADEVHYDMSDGPLKTTGDQNHLALKGPGFFMVQGEDGVLLQRAGNFQRDSDNMLVNDKGQLVLGDGGPIEISDNQDFIVSRDGAIRTTSGEEVGEIRVVEADAVIPVGHSQWRAAEGVRTAQNVEVIQGALEGSNADPIRGMVELVEASRYFEAYQKAMQTSDSLDGRTNEIMRTR
jgi:flagellar basal-body rod protein FlgF